MNDMQQTSTVRRFTFNVGWVLIGQAITLFMSFLLRVLLGRFLGAHDLGLFTMSLTIFTLATFVGGIGIPTAIVKFVAENRQAENRHILNSFISCGLVNGAIFGIFIGLVLFFISSILANLFHMPELTSLVKIIALALPFSILSDTLLLGLLTGLGKMKLYSIGIACRSILLLGLAVLFVKIGWGITGAVSSITIGYAGASVLSLFLAWKYFHFSLRNYFRTFNRLISFGTQLFLAETIWTLNITADRFFIGYFLVEKDVGIYAIALAIASAFQIIPAVVSKVTYPMMSEYYSKGLHLKNELLMNKTIKYTLLIQSTIGILIIFFARDITSLLVGSEFLPAVTPLTILVLGNIFFGAAAAIGSAFGAIDRPDIIYKVNMIVLPVNLILDILLIPRIGIMGAAIGTATSLSINIILGLYFYKKVNIKIDWRNYVRIGILIAPIVILFHIFNGHLNLFLLTCPLFGAYIILIAKFAFTKEDIKDLKEIIKQVS